MDDRVIRGVAIVLMVVILGVLVRLVLDLERTDIRESEALKSYAKIRADCLNHSDFIVTYCGLPQANTGYLIEGSVNFTRWFVNATA